MHRKASLNDLTYLFAFLLSDAGVNIGLFFRLSAGHLSGLALLERVNDFRRERVPADQSVPPKLPNVAQLADRW